MGNQNSRTKIKLPPKKPSTHQNEHIDQQKSIDLDEIVERWSWTLWERTKTKSLARLKREDLLIQINWNRVTFTQNEVRFFDPSTQHLPKSQTLFRTNFTNRTSSEQLYQLKTDRTTRSTYSFTFTESLTTSQKSQIVFRLPEDIVQLGGGIQYEQNVDLGHDTIKENTLHWTIDSPVIVAPWTRADAKLIIDEEEYRSDFMIPLQFSGRVSVTFTKRQAPESPIKFLDGDIVQILQEAIETTARTLKGIEIFDGEQPYVNYTLRGHCLFRFGIAHHIVLNYEKINRVVSIPVIHFNSNSPSTYRSVRTQFVSPQIRQPSPVHLVIRDDDYL